MTVERHLCLDASHVGNVGVLFTYYLQHVHSVIGGQDVCVVFGISHHRGPHLFVDRRFSVLEIIHRSSFPNVDVASRIQQTVLSVLNITLKTEFFLQLYIKCQQ